MCTCPLLSRAGDTADLPNTQKQTLRARHSEDAEGRVPEERTGQRAARNFSKMEKCNMPDGEVQLMVIKTLTGLEKAVEDLSETLNTDKKKQSDDEHNK